MNLTIELLENIGPTLGFIKEASMGPMGYTLTAAGVGAAAGGVRGYLREGNKKEKLNNALKEAAIEGIASGVGSHMLFRLAHKQRANITKSASSDKLPGALLGGALGALGYGGLGYMSGRTDEEKKKLGLLTGTLGGMVGATAGYTGALRGLQRYITKK